MIKRGKPNPFELDENKMARIVVDYLQQKHGIIDGYESSVNKQSYPRTVVSFQDGAHLRGTPGQFTSISNVNIMAQQSPMEDNMMPQLDGETDVIDDVDINDEVRGQEGHLPGLKRGFTKKTGGSSVSKRTWGVKNPEER